MRVEETDLLGVKIVTPERSGDDSGWRSITYDANLIELLALGAALSEDSHSLTLERGTVRGLHFQIPPCSQAKLVRVLSGSVIDVAVDLRQSSPTYGRHVAVELSARNWRQLLIPEGFAHGFCTLEPKTQVLYKLSGRYAPEDERGVAWDDPALAINWPVHADQAILSEKDRRHPGLGALPRYFV